MRVRRFSGVIYRNDDYTIRVRGGKNEEEYHVFLDREDIAEFDTFSAACEFIRGQLRQVR